MPADRNVVHTSCTKRRARCQFILTRSGRADAAPVRAQVDAVKAEFTNLQNSLKNVLKVDVSALKSVISKIGKQITDLTALETKLAEVHARLANRAVDFLGSDEALDTLLAVFSDAERDAAAAPTVAALGTLIEKVDTAGERVVLLTEVVCILGADMVINHHTRSLPAMLIIAAIGVFGSIAVARFVARKENPR